MQATYHNHYIVPPTVDCPEAAVPSDMDEYLFDLQGYVVIRNALSKEEVEACNACIDRIPRSVPRNGWFGRVHREDHPEHRGISYQQVYEAGVPFERLIDHPSYINYVARFVGGHETYDRFHGSLFIDENFYNIRGPGESIPIHAGGHDRCKRMSFGYHNGRFQCGQINVLMAFNDIGPGDGATMVIPGSHKSNIVHPDIKRPRQHNPWSEEGGESMDGIAGAVEVFLKAGDVIVFVDSCCHGSSKRVNPNERRIAVFRYGSTWNRTRFGYEPSEELLGRLNPFARSIVSTGQRLLPT